MKFLGQKLKSLIYMQEMAERNQVSLFKNLIIIINVSLLLVIQFEIKSKLGIWLRLRLSQGIVILII